MTQSLPWNSISQHVALLMGSLFLWWFCRKENLQPDWKKGLFLFTYFFICAFIGGRIFSFWETSLASQTDMNWGIFGMRAAEGKLRWYGSMLFFLLLLPVFLLYFRGTMRWKYFDAFALATCVYIIFVKQGCHFAGDGCYGIPTKLPWGMYYAEGLRPSLIPVHPTPVYDSLFHLLLVIFLFRYRSKFSASGRLGLAFFTLSSIFCFFLEFIRRNPDAAFGLTLAQWTYALVFLLAVILWAWHILMANNKLYFFTRTLTTDEP